MEVLYEKLPRYCANCCMIGHPLSQCKKLQKKDGLNENGDVRVRNSDNLEKNGNKNIQYDNFADKATKCERGYGN